MNIRLLTLTEAQTKETYQEIINKYINTLPLSINTKVNTFAVLEIDSRENNISIESIVTLLSNNKTCLILINYSNMLFNYDRTININAPQLFDKLLTEQLYKSIPVSNSYKLYGMYNDGLLLH